MPVIMYAGSHNSVFPIVLGKEPKYETRTSHDIILGFSDYAYQMPGMVMHYIGDKDALGWEHGWKPQQDFIDRVMKGGEITFSFVKNDKVVQMPSRIGFLTLGVNDKKGKIVDTHGGDKHLQVATLAELGSVPECFIERMDFIVKEFNRINFSKDEEVQNEKLILEPAKGYENIEFAPHKKQTNFFDFSMEHRLTEIENNRLEGKKQELNPIEKYADTAVAHLEYFSPENSDVALAKIRKDDIGFFDYKLNKDKDKKIADNPEQQVMVQEYIRKELEALGFKTDSVVYPFIKLSGDSFKKLKEIDRGLITVIPENPTIEDKIKVVFGYKPDKVEVEGNNLLIHSDWRLTSSHNIEYELGKKITRNDEFKDKFEYIEEKIPGKLERTLEFRGKDFNIAQTILDEIEERYNNIVQEVSRASAKPSTALSQDDFKELLKGEKKK